MKQVQVVALFTLADIDIINVCQNENRYWPDSPSYNSVRNSSPWWKVTTTFGDVVVGYRKRVILIDWIDTNKRGIVTTDDVTKDDHMVHAWSITDAVLYLAAFARLPTVPASEMYLQQRHFQGKKQVLDGLHLLAFHSDDLVGEQKASIDRVIELVKATVEDTHVEMSYQVAVEHRTYRFKIGKLTIQINP